MTMTGFVQKSIPTARWLVLALAILVCSGSKAYATEAPPEAPLKFMSLRADKVFARAGPALRYPIEWIYQKKGLPVLVIQQYDAWRKIQDIDGGEGWVHQSLLSQGRTAIIRSSEALTIRENPGNAGRIRARLEPGVIAPITQCRQGWCEIEISGFRGWAERKYLWGIAEGEEFN